jgi:hypothetical protein
MIKIELDSDFFKTLPLNEFGTLPMSNMSKEALVKMNQALLARLAAATQNQTA